MTIICSICIENLSENDSVYLPCGHAFDRDCILQCLRLVAVCPLCKQACSISQIRHLYLSADASDSSLDQCDLARALHLTHTKLLLCTITLELAQDKYARLQRDHEIKKREGSQAALRITQLTEDNRNSNLAYNRLLEENNQFRASKYHWWKQQEKEQEKGKMTYKRLLAQVYDSITKNKKILKESKNKFTKSEDLLSARKEAMNSIKALIYSWSIVQDNFKYLLNSYNDVKEEFNMTTVTSSKLCNSIIKFNDSVKRTRSAYDEMQQKMNSYNAILINDQRIQRRVIVLFYSIWAILSYGLLWLIYLGKIVTTTFFSMTITTATTIVKVIIITFVIISYVITKVMSIITSIAIVITMRRSITTITISAAIISIVSIYYMYFYIKYWSMNMH